MIHLLNATKRLTNYEATITSIINDVLKKYEKITPITDVDIIVAENQWRTVPEQGIGGYTSTAHEITVSLDLGQKDINENINRYLAPTMAHELAHIVRLQAGLSLAGGRLGDSVVGEGLADHLSRHLYPDCYIPWVTAVQESELTELKSRFVAKWQDSPYDHNSWFYGNKDKNLPRWTGYSLGFALVEDYLQATSKNITDTLTTPTNEIMKAWY